MSKSPYAREPLLEHLDALRAAANAGEPVTPPLHVRLEPTQACNFSCRFCMYHDPERRAVDGTELDTDGKRNFPIDRLLGLVDELAEIGTRAISMAGAGDPLVYPHVGPLLRRIRERGLSCGVTSNLAMRLKEDVIDELGRCEWVRWSFNGGTKAAFDDIHRPRGNAPEQAYQRSIDNAAAIARAAKIHGRCTFNVSYVVHESNVPGIYVAAQIARDVGAASILFRPDTPYERQDQLIAFSAEAMAEMERAQQDFESVDFNVVICIERLEDVELFANGETPCRYINHSTYITAAGDVYPCCYTRNYRRYVLGSILDRPFKEFWNETARRQAYRKLTVNQCPACPHGALIGALDALAGGKVTAEDLHASTDRPRPFV